MAMMLKSLNNDTWLLQCTGDESYGLLMVTCCLIIPMFMLHAIACSVSNWFLAVCMQCSVSLLLPANQIITNWFAHGKKWSIFKPLLHKEPETCFLPLFFRQNQFLILQYTTMFWNFFRLVCCISRGVNWRQLDSPLILFSLNIYTVLK